MDTEYRALVVDDDPIARKMLAHSLGKEGFTCDTAVDGVHAHGLLEIQPYDLVITDLKMPNRHGHSLALELLRAENRPIIIIHTSVDDPKIAKDLLGRGVDDIVYKPTNYAALVAKATALIERRRMRQPTAQPSDDQPADEDSGKESPGTAEKTPTPDVPQASLADTLERRLASISQVLPLSQTALDVYMLTAESDVDVLQIAAAVECDAALTAEVLRLGNSAYYNPSGDDIEDLEAIIVRVGRRRVGELALATSAHAAEARKLVPWLDLTLDWERSIAAGVAIDMLVEIGGHTQTTHGLFLSAIMHPLGRLALATALPDEHRALTEQCREQGTCLTDAETRLFTKSHVEVMAHLLTEWNIPPDVIFPLKHLLTPYAELQVMPRHESTQVELLKMAVLVGQFAARHWNPWDWIEPAPESVCRRLCVTSLANLIRQTRADMTRIVDSRTHETTDHEVDTHPQPHPIEYRTLSGEAYDMLAELLPALGLESVDPRQAESPPDILINALAASSSNIADYRDEFRVRPGQRPRIVAHAEIAEQLEPHGDVFLLPATFEQLREACSPKQPVSV